MQKCACTVTHYSDAGWSAFFPLSQTFSDSPLACAGTLGLGAAAEKYIFLVVKENFYHLQGHLKFVCILFSSTLNNFRSQITGAHDQSAFRLVQETQELYATL